VAITADDHELVGEVAVVGDCKLDGSGLVFGWRVDFELNEADLDCSALGRRFGGVRGFGGVSSVSLSLSLHAVSNAEKANSPIAIRFTYCPSVEVRTSIVLNPEKSPGTT
jgi:hypothetical protein